MKKIKLLAPLLGVSTLATAVIPMVSCGTFEKETSDVLEVVIQGDPEFTLSKYVVNKGEKYEADITWINTKKIVEINSIGIMVGEKPLREGFTYTPGALGSAKGHLVINEGLITDKVTIEMCLIDDENQKVKIVANNVNQTSIIAGWEAIIPTGQEIAWVGEDAIVQIYWSNDLTNVDTRFYSWETIVKLEDGTVIPQSSEKNLLGFSFLEYYENGMKIKIPGKNITSNQSINISLDLQQSDSKYYGYNVDNFESRNVQYPAQTGTVYDTLTSVRLPAVSAGQYIEFSIDLNNWFGGAKEGELFDGPIYFMIGENVSDTGGNIVSIQNGSLGDIWYGNEDLDSLVAYDGYVTINKPANGWGKIGNLSRITGWYHFQAAHNSVEIYAGQPSKPQ